MTPHHEPNEAPVPVRGAGRKERWRDGLSGCEREQLYDCEVVRATVQRHEKDYKL